ncbi:gastrula zinc finger protein XlCGF49.1-like [Octopus vulgaris]|uniref:Gastrula zinc finger protein XlCGF49.1-like n=1 Tax=Octopus vulgaris TaxID=6645 RepID=A0AA36FFM7_OCTVU|nr:gastrula zinc finger protein XlCGF49.1-like [Octopus vulgaris]
MKYYSALKLFPVFVDLEVFQELKQKKYRLRNMYPGQSVYTMSQKFSCDECDEAFPLYDLLKAHIRTTHSLASQQQRSYCCAICNKAFTQRTNLRTHERVHSGERPYKCAMCSKAFYQRTNLRNHIRTHTNERPYTCTVCGRAFTQRGNLYLHERIHSGIRPFQCNICERAFSQKGNLKSHLRTHERKKDAGKNYSKVEGNNITAFACGECGKAFQRQSLLKCHEKTHQLEQQSLKQKGCEDKEEDMTLSNYKQSGISQAVFPDTSSPLLLRITTK